MGGFDMHHTVIFSAESNIDVDLLVRVHDQLFPCTIGSQRIGCHLSCIRSCDLPCELHSQGRRYCELKFVHPEQLHIFRNALLILEMIAECNSLNCYYLSPNSL